MSCTKWSWKATGRSKGRARRQSELEYLKQQARIVSDVVVAARLAGVEPEWMQGYVCGRPGRPEAVLGT